MARHLIPKSFPIALAGLLALLLAVSGCGGAREMGSTTSAPSTSTSVSASLPESTVAPAGPEMTDPEAVIAEAAGRVEAVLGLPAGAVTLASTGPSSETLPSLDADIVLTWEGRGAAWVALETGRILGIIPGIVGDSSGQLLDTVELEDAAVRAAEILGWDEATLAAEGFVSEEPAIIPHGDAPTEYSRRWAGRDGQGLPNGGMVYVALDATNAALLHFFYHPGAQSELDTSAAISRDEAIAIAREVIGDDAQVPTTDTAPPGRSPPTTTPLGVVLRSAELVHSNAPGITGGRDMLVWIVKLGGSQTTGEVRATIYVDALSGEVLTWVVG